MGTATAWIVIDGMLIGGLLTWLISLALPSQPHLETAVANLAPSNLFQPAQSRTRPLSVRQRAGYWADRNLAGLRGFRAPQADLNLVGITREQFYTDKVTSAFVGFIAPALLMVLNPLLHLGLPIGAPAFLCLVFAVIFWRRPDAQVKVRAWQARRDFKAASVAFLRLTGVMRLSGRGVKTSMEDASRLSGEWMFQRISQALYLAHYQQRPPWEAIDDLADQLHLDELHQIAVICRVGGTGGNVSGALMSSASDMRRQLLDEQRRDAAETSVAISIRTSLLVGIFVAMLITPMIINLVA